MLGDRRERFLEGLERRDLGDELGEWSRLRGAVLDVLPVRPRRDPSLRLGPNETFGVGGGVGGGGGGG